jgi:hypothetical protein
MSSIFSSIKRKSVETDDAPKDVKSCKVDNEEVNREIMIEKKVEQDLENELENEVEERVEDNDEKEKPLVENEPEGGGEKEEISDSETGDDMDEGITDDVATPVYGGGEMEDKTENDMVEMKKDKGSEEPDVIEDSDCGSEPGDKEGDSDMKNGGTFEDFDLDGITSPNPENVIKRCTVKKDKVVVKSLVKKEKKEKKAPRKALSAKNDKIPKTKKEKKPKAPKAAKKVKGALGNLSDFSSDEEVFDVLPGFQNDGPTFKLFLEERPTFKNFLRELTKQNAIAANGGVTSSVRLKILMDQAEEEDKEQTAAFIKVAKQKKASDKKAADKKVAAKNNEVKNNEVKNNEVKNKDVDEMMEDGE